MYKFCKPFEGDWNREYSMKWDAPRCGEVDGDTVFMCREHMQKNWQEVQDIKINQTKAFHDMGGELVDDTEDYVQTLQDVSNLPQVEAVRHSQNNP